MLLEAGKCYGFMFPSGQLYVKVQNTVDLESVLADSWVHTQVVDAQTGDLVPAHYRAGAIPIVFELTPGTIAQLQANIKKRNEEAAKTSSTTTSPSLVSVVVDIPGAVLATPVKAVTATGTVLGSILK